MNCNELKQSPVLVQYLTSESNTDVDRAMNCFYELFYTKFKKIGGNWCYTRSYAKQNSDLLTDDAFNRGLFHFYKKIRENGFEEIASVETAFISSCLKQLMGVVKTELRVASKNSSKEPEVIFDEKTDLVKTDPWLAMEQNDQLKRKEDIFKKALSMLDEKCRNLIIWRKYLQLSNEEIADRSQRLQPQSVNNEVFKCMNSLKKIVSNLENQF